MLGSVQRKLLVAVGATATLVLGGLIAFLTTQATGELGRAASERLQLKSERLGTALHGELVRYQKVAETLASAMERYQRQGASRTEASQMVRQVAAQNPKALGTYLAYEPDAFDGQDALHEADSASGSNPGGRFAPYWNRYGEGLGLSPLADLESQDWYTRPVESGEPLIKGPFVYDGKLMLSFLHPIERDGVPVGVGGVDVSVDYWQQRAREMQVQESGYAFIVSPNGKLVAHPNEQWAGTETLQSLGDSLSLSAFDQMDDHLSAGGGDQQFQFTDPVTGQEATAWLHSTETSGFAIGTVAPQAEMRAGAHYLRNVFLGIGLVSLLGLLGATYVLLRRWVIGPLSVVTEKVQAVAGGDRSVQIQNRWGDEFGTLAASFNDMTAQIRESRDHLQEEREKAQEKRREADRLAEASQEKSEFLRSELEELTGRIRRMAEGDLTVSFKTDRESASGSDTDEAAQLVGKLREALSTAVASMHSALQAVTTASQETATAVRQISSSSDQMAASAEEQSAQAEEVAAAVEQLNQTIGENARSVQQVADAAGDGSQQAQEGQEVVAEATGKMEEIAEEVQGTAETIERLQASSEEISQVVDTIDDIAGQTNLLALNAAIEASRAGGTSGGENTGQGFGVVAEEVRQLAEETDQATTEIAEIIGEVQEEIEAAVKAARQSSANAEEGIDLSRKASGVLEEIVASIEEVEEQADEIAAASEEQSATSEEIARSVESISTAAQQSAAGVTKVSDTADRLETLSEELEETVEKFNVGAGQSQPRSFAGNAA